jgi:bacterioferritin (cytochrome b1)
MPQINVMDRTWIASEFVKGINAERSLAAESKVRADAPPEPGLGVLYHEIAAADERHAAIIERIATRYGHTPASSLGSGIGQALGHLKDKFAELGSSPLDQLSGDLATKGRSVHWHIAWVHALEAIGDTESARELSVVLTEEQEHRDALQQSFNRMVEQRACRTNDVSNGSAAPEAAH